MSPLSDHTQRIVNTRVQFVKLSQKYTGYTALHNSQSHGISQSQALSARFIIFCFRYHGNTVLNATVPAVLPQSLSPLPRYYRSSCFHYRGKSAVLPLSPCRSLLRSPCNEFFTEGTRPKVVLRASSVRKARLQHVVVMH